MKWTEKVWSRHLILIDVVMAKSLSLLIFFKWANPSLFLFIFSLFNQTLQFYSKSMWKCPSSIWRRDSNSQPSDYESPPITTRLGLPSLSFSAIAKRVLCLCKNDHRSLCNKQILEQCKALWLAAASHVSSFKQR